MFEENPGIFPNSIVCLERSLKKEIVQLSKLTFVKVKVYYQTLKGVYKKMYTVTMHHHSLINELSILGTASVVF